MSSPTVFRSSRTSSRSHSRTGSLPASVRKNTTSRIGRRRSCSRSAGAIKEVYHHWYTQGNAAFECRWRVTAGRVGARSEPRGCLLRLPAAFHTLPSESFFESPPTKMRVIPEENRHCDRPYSGSWRFAWARATDSDVLSILVRSELELLRHHGLMPPLPRPRWPPPAESR